MQVLIVISCYQVEYSDTTTIPSVGCLENFETSDVLCVIGMYESRAWMYGVFIVSWLCWRSSLPIRAQPSITHPIEGDFDSVYPLFNYFLMIHKLPLATIFSRGCLFRGHTQHTETCFIYS